MISCFQLAFGLNNPSVVSRQSSTLMRDAPLLVDMDQFDVGRPGLAIATARLLKA
jgi:hypothetical protein